MWTTCYPSVTPQYLVGCKKFCKGETNNYLSSGRRGVSENTSVTFYPELPHDHFGESEPVVFDIRLLRQGVGKRQIPRVEERGQ